MGTRRTLILACVFCALLAGAPAAFAVANAERFPEPQLVGKVSINEAIASRRSVRRYQDRPILAAQLGQLLWATQGITEPSRGLRAAPSAGALYPLTVYVAKADGLFRYLPDGHAIEKIGDKDLRAQLAKVSYNQRWMARAPVHVIIAADYDVIAKRYADHARPYTHIEVGCAAENLSLQAIDMGLGSCIVGAFDPKEVARALDLPKNETVQIIVPVGFPE